MFPLLILLVGLFMPKPPEWNPFQEAKISPTQRASNCVAWPTEYVAEFLALAVTDSGVDSGAALPSTLVFWRSIFHFFPSAGERPMKGYLRERGAYKLEWAAFRKSMWPKRAAA
jgi:hypothetical protein